MNSAPVTLDEWAASPIWEDSLREQGRDKEGRFRLWGNTQPFDYTPDMATAEGDIATGLRHWPRHGDSVTIQPPSDAPLDLDLWEVKARVYERGPTWSSCRKRIRFYVRAADSKAARHYVETYFREARREHRTSWKASFEGSKVGYTPAPWTFKTGISPATKIDRLPSGTIPAETRGELDGLSYCLVLWLHHFRAVPEDEHVTFRKFQTLLTGYDLCDLSESVRLERDHATEHAPTSQGTDALAELAPRPEPFTPPTERQLSFSL